MENGHSDIIKEGEPNQTTILQVEKSKTNLNKENSHDEEVLKPGYQTKDGQSEGKKKKI